MLSLAGYDVDERDVAEASNRLELEDLGFVSVPVAVIGGRAVAGYPEGPLRALLGLPPMGIDLPGMRAKLDSILVSLRMLASITRHIPDRYWALRLVPQRDRALGQWVWHVFYVADDWITRPDTAFETDRLNVGAERRYWRVEPQFRTFAAIADYGTECTERLEAWGDNELASALRRHFDRTPWGRVTMMDVLSHIDRHSAVHLRQVIVKLGELDPTFAHLPSREEVAQIPDYSSLTDD